MHGYDGRFSKLRWLQNVVCAAGMVGALALIGLGLSGYGASAAVWLVALGCFVAFIVIMVLTVVPLLLKMESTAARQLTELRDLKEVVSKRAAVLDAIAQNTRVSDAARSVAFREEESDILHERVRAAIRQERWEHAQRLVDDIEERLGYKEQAGQFREELDHARTDAIDKKLAEAIEQIETHFRSQEWDLAQSEIDRLKQALPGEPKVLGLPGRMKALKEEHKEELRHAWDEAVRRSDTDQAIDVLKELDQYLSPEEAHALQSSARDVFKEKLLQLGIQFRFAVTEKRWQDALVCGLELVREFPNARMAKEVREVLDTLRERARQAGGTEAAGAGVPTAKTTPADEAP